MSESQGKEKPVPEDFRSGFIAVVGVPNVGKSTLVNQILGEKVAIVTPKAQTTRGRIHGVINEPTHQIILVDTPGVCGDGTALHRAMRRIGSDVALEADAIWVVVDVGGEASRGGSDSAQQDYRGLGKRELHLVEAARQGKGKLIVVLNKVDRVKPKQRLLPMMQTLASQLGDGVDIVPVSARNADGLEALIELSLTALPVGQPLFPRDIHTDQAERLLCEELVREQILLQTHEEVPHGVAVVLEEFIDERRDDPNSPGLCTLTGRIIVERDSQKGIVVGKGGSRIKAISEFARKEMEALLGSKVFLRLQVIVDRDWRHSAAGIRKYGFDNES